MSIFYGSGYISGQLITLYQNGDQFRCHVLGQSPNHTSVMSHKRKSFRGHDKDSTWNKAVKWAKEHPVETVFCPHCGGRGFIDK
jgi:hypothetical protein